MVIACRIPTGVVRISLLADPCHTRDVRRFAVGMIEQDEVANFHYVTHHIAGLVITNPVPVSRAICDKLCVGVNIKFRFHQPTVDHASPSSRASMNCSSPGVDNFVDQCGIKNIDIDWFRPAKTKAFRHGRATTNSPKTCFFEGDEDGW